MPEISIQGGDEDASSLSVMGFDVEKSIHGASLSQRSSRVSNGIQAATMPAGVMKE